MAFSVCCWPEGDTVMHPHAGFGDSERALSKETALRSEQAGTVSVCGGENSLFFLLTTRAFCHLNWAWLQCQRNYRCSCQWPDLAALRFVEALILLVLLFQRVQDHLGVLPVLDGAIGHGVGHDAELAQEDLPQEQVDPGVQDLVEGGHADGREEKVTVQVAVLAGAAA